MTSLTYAVEMYMGTAWADVTGDVRMSGGIRAGGGLLGSSVTDRVAPPGLMQFDMDNSLNNSGGTVGYYSPDHAAARSGFDVGTQVRLKLTSGTLTYYPFHGRIKAIDPAMGLYRERNVRVTAADYMEQPSIHKVDKIQVQLNKRNDQMLGTIVANMPIAPLNTSYAVGPDTFPTGLNAEEDEKTFANTVMQKMAQSGLDYIYVRGNATDGETFVYESRQTRMLNTTVKATLNNTMSELDIERTAENIWNTVKVTVYPDSYDTDPVVLYSSSSEMELAPGQSTTFTARFRDPAGKSNRISVYPGSEVTPVAGTDFIFSLSSDNLNGELNASLTVAVTWGANTAEVTLTNSGTQTGYVQKGFQLRGRGIYHYDPVDIIKTDSTSKTTHGDKTLSFSVPYQGSNNVATDFANVILSKYHDPRSQIGGVSFFANRSSALMTAALTCMIGDRITIVEPVTGISGDFYINGVNYTINAGGILRVNWILESADSTQVWLLDDAAWSLLDSTTYLGF